jgi:hypothetical protein
MQIWSVADLDGSSRGSKDTEMSRNEWYDRAKCTPSVVWVATDKRERTVKQLCSQIRFISSLHRMPLSYALRASSSRPGVAEHRHLTGAFPALFAYLARKVHT